MITLSEILNFIFPFLIVAGGVYHAFAIFSVHAFFGEEKRHSRTGSDQPVSIIKPLKGPDYEFEKNIESFCEQAYPEYEVLLGFSEPGDPAMPRVEQIINHLNHCNIRRIVSTNNPGPNRKISNLQGLIESARYGLLAISDSDMRAERSYLGDIVQEYASDENVGMVTCMYKISDPKAAGNALESLTIALDFIPSVLVARRLEGITFGLGASMLISRQTLQDTGGLSPIADYLADDYQLGNRIWKKGYKILLSHVVLENISGPMSVREYLVHQLRWARTYRASRPRGFFGYGITHILPFSLLFFALEPSAFTLSIIGAVLLLRLILGIVLYSRVIRSKKWLKWLIFFPLKDILAFCIWAWSFTGRRVSWKGRSFEISPGGRMREWR